MLPLTNLRRSLACTHDSSFLRKTQRIVLLVWAAGVMNVLVPARAATGDSKVTYTISSENNITGFATAKEAKSAPDVERFATAKELTKLAEQWPAARLVDIWNALPGVVPAKRFTSRKTAVVRVWAAIQNLAPKAGAQPTRVGAKRAKARQQASPQEKTPPAREGSKKADVLALLRREGGATLLELRTGLLARFGSFRHHTGRLCASLRRQVL